MAAALVMCAPAAAGFLAQPWLTRLTRARAPRAAPTRWLGRGVLTAGSAAAGAAYFTPGPAPVKVALAAAAAIGWWLACIDAAIHRLPDPLIALLIGVLVTGMAAAVLTGAAPAPALVRALAAGVLTAGGFAALAVLRPSAMGLGDVKLSGALGAATGWFGLGVLLQWLLLAFVAGGLAAAALLLTRRLGPKDTIAFGPWLILGAAGAIALATSGVVTH